MILEVVIKYDPYRKATYMTVDGLDVMTVPDSAGYGKFRKQIEKKVPIQTWLEKRGEWRGILNELISEQSSDNLTFNFSGRKIDFDDLKHACESQNEERGNFRCNLKFNLEYEITDEQMARNIEEVVGILQSDRFRKLVEESRLDPGLEEKYKNFKSNYDRARNAEFTITVAGIFSSGKSTIINSLMRHNALPVSYKTCTKKVCKIRDNPELKPNELNLLICDENKHLKKKACFSDADKAVNDKKCSELIESIKAESGDTILEANLGHLYPNEKSREMFKLVIVDTPGTDSNKAVNKEGINIDENTALNAVFDSKDEMVILSIKADDVDSGGLTRLIKAISNKFGGNKDGDKDSVGDSFVYNDRFLFVANKCDQIPFNHEETTTDLINCYRETLKNETKNPSFNPRIFPLCAAVPAYLYAGDKSESCEKAFYGFYDYIYGVDVGKGSRRYHTDPNPNYYFSQHCDIPQYKKVQYAARFNKIKESDEDNALLIQSGFVCLEDAIKDYVERFAYPIRINRILRTYETIPGSVINCIKAQEQTLKDRMDELKGAQDEGKTAVEKEKEEKERADKLAKAKSVIEKLKGEVEDCAYDASALFTASNDLCANVDRILYGHGKMDYDKACEVFADIQKSVEYRLNVFSEAIIRFGKDYMNRVEYLVDKIQYELNELKESGILDLGEFDFSKSSVFTEKIEIDFGNVSIDSHSTYQYKVVPNPEKNAYCSFWDLLGHIKKAFAKKSIIKIEQIVDMDELVGDIKNEITDFIDKTRLKISKSYKEYTEEKQSKIKKKLDKICNKFIESMNNVSNFRKNASEKFKTVEDLVPKIDEARFELQWLTVLNKKMQAFMPWETMK